MFMVESSHPPGMVLVISNELSRYADFSISLLQLMTPVGTTLLWQKGVEVAMSLNYAIRKMGDAQWIFILGDDHAFKRNILFDLLNDQVDIVTPVCPSRTYPFNPVSYVDYNGSLAQLTWKGLPEHQIHELGGAGSAGMLIRRRVLDAIGDPWFQAGKHHTESLGEDLYFCIRARQLGFKVHVDTRYAIGHITPATLWPGDYNDVRQTLINLNGDEKRWFPTSAMINVKKTHMPNVSGLCDE
jgi:hypothetical protein